MAIFGGISLQGGVGGMPLAVTGARVVSISYPVAKDVPDRVAEAWCGIVVRVFEGNVCLLDLGRPSDLPMHCQR